MNECKRGTLDRDNTTTPRNFDSICVDVRPWGGFSEMLHHALKSREDNVLASIPPAWGSYELRSITLRVLDIFERLRRICLTLQNQTAEQLEKLNLQIA